MIGGFSRLQALDLERGLITDEGIAHLAGLIGLERLSLAGLKITDRGVNSLKDLRNLQSLNLTRTPVGDDVCSPCGRSDQEHCRMTI